MNSFQTRMSKMNSKSFKFLLQQIQYSKIGQQNRTYFLLIKCVQNKKTHRLKIYKFQDPILKLKLQKSLQIRQRLESIQMQNSSEQQNHSSSPQKATSPNDILQQLKSIYERVLQEQKRQLNEILNLQKVLNYVQSTVAGMKSPQEEKGKAKQVKQQKKQFNVQRIGQKIQELIDQSGDVSIVETVAANNKTNLLPVIKGKKQTKKQLVVQKKPAIPKGNRSNEPSSKNIISTKYVPPRNKNQVTGKVTQTKITSQQKVFRPEVTGKVGTSQNFPTSTLKPQIHLSSSVQKRTSTISISHPPSSSSSSSIQKHPPAQKSPSNIPPHLQPDSNSISEYKNLRANTKVTKLKQFRKPLEQLAQQIMNKKQSQKKKFNFTQLIEKYQNQEMGHRAVEDKRRKQFIKKFGNLSLSINSAHLHQITHSAPKRVWKQYPHIFEFNDLLQSFQRDIDTLQEQVKDDLRIDPKQAYRLQIKRQLLAIELEKIRQSTEIQVPQKLELTFKPLVSMKKVVYQSSPAIDFGPLYQKLHDLLHQVQQQQSLSTKDLSQLRVISSIAMYNGRRSPVIVQAQQLQNWKFFYEQVDDVQRIDNIS